MLHPKGTVPVIVIGSVILSYIILHEHIRNVYVPAIKFIPQKLLYRRQYYGNVDNIENVRNNHSYISKQKTPELVIFSHTLSETDWMTKMEEKYRKINERINEVCQRHRKESSGKFDAPNKYKQILGMVLDMKHRLGYCAIAKVGSTTWMNHFLALLPSKVRQDVSKVRKPYFHKTVARKFRLPVDSIIHHDDRNVQKTSFVELLHHFLRKSQILTFSFVRHPFERLVSAYKDKILSGHFRRMGYTEYKNLYTFPEFINKVLQEYKNDEKCHSSYNQACVGINDHWRPYNSACLYCDIPYDVIGHDMEYFNDDVKYILLKQNMGSIIPLKNSSLHAHSSDENTHHKESAKDQTLMYFSKLSKLQIQQLYKMYRFDFELFNYDIESYFRLTSKH